MLLPTYFHVMTPSVFTTNVAGLARPPSPGLSTSYSWVTTLEGSLQDREGDTQLPSDVLCAAEVVHADGNHLSVQRLYSVVSPCQLTELSLTVGSPEGPVEDYYEVLVASIGLQGHVRL